jgi:hypothetical protein
MAGYTPPPGVYFLDTFALYQGVGNLYPATGSASSKRITENFVADVAIVGWFPDSKLFGADPGFAVTVPSLSDRNSPLPSVRPSGAAAPAKSPDTAPSLAGTRVSTIGVTVTGFAPTENILPNQLALSEPPCPRSQGGLYVTRS